VTLPRITLVAAILLLAAGVEVPAIASPADAERLFESHVRPLLVGRCQECHGGKLAEAGLRLDSRRALLAGGDAGPVVVPGDAGKSRLIAAVRHAGEIAMPPDGKLADEEIRLLEAWIAAGAPWSGSGGDEDASAASDRGTDMQRRLDEALRTHWAFRPPTTRPAPVVPDAAPAARGWNESAIDRFLLARIVDAGLSPSPEAAPRELIRRLWYDLTGLPPPADVADAFVRNPSDASYRGHVERLLASRQHAEHWARKWLDLARYADTMGYAFDNQDNRYPFAWTYRDWVIGALARDLPFDRFVTLQLAADLVEPPVEKPDLAALGFLTCGRSFLGNTHDIIDDRIDLVTRGLMGLTVACARCHDHKYEPVTTADYYALHGIFDSSQMPEELPVISEPPPGDEAEAFGRKLAELRQAIADHESAVHVRAVREAVAHAKDYFLETARPTPRGDDNRPPKLADGYELEQLILDRLARLFDKKPESHPILGPWIAVRSLPDAEVAARIAALVAAWAGGPTAPINAVLRDEIRSAKPATLAEVAEVYARLVARVAPARPEATPVEKPGDTSADLEEFQKLLAAEGTPLVVPRGDAMRVAKRDEETELRRRKKRVTEHFAESPGGPPHAMVLVDREKPHDSRIFIRGNPSRPGDVVKRRLPAVLGGREVSRESSGRLDLARAIVSPDNPLTARTIVNWVWTHHFGRGLVETHGDLGLRGEPPSHPEILDDLARRFIEEGGSSFRWLHREIVLSRAFRQSSGIRPELTARDPDNRLLARANRRRLDWESWRDGLLVAAGTLDLDHAGGRGVDPLASGAMHVRSVYATLDRQDVPGILRVFDIANPDTAVHVRPRTSVPQQSLAALNAPIVVEAAGRAAARVSLELGDTSDESAWAVGIWRAVLGRSPTDEERSIAVAWLEEEARADGDGVPAVGHHERFAHALMATSEFHHVD